MTDALSFSMRISPNDEEEDGKSAIDSEMGRQVELHDVGVSLESPNGPPIKARHNNMRKVNLTLVDKNTSSFHEWGSEDRLWT